MSQQAVSQDSRFNFDFVILPSILLYWIVGSGFGSGAITNLLMSLFFFENAIDQSFKPIEEDRIR